MEENIRQFLEALRVPDVAQQKRVSEADDGNVDGRGSLQTGSGAVWSKGCLAKNDGDEKVAEDGEEAEVVGEDKRKAETFVEADRDGEIKLQREGGPGDESQ